MVERDLSLSRAEDRPIHLMHLSARESVAALDAALATVRARRGEVTPHHLVLTDEAVRSLDPNTKMNPPLRSATTARRFATRFARRDHVCRHRSRTTRAAREGRPVRGGAVRRHRLETAFAALHTHLVLPGVSRSRRCSSGCRRPGTRLRPRRAADRGGARANLVALDLDAEWTWTRTASARSPRTRGSSARRCGAASSRPSPTDAGVRGVSGGYLVLEDGTVFRGRSVARDGVAFGEAVFTTGMTGYQETVTDPSYAEQLVCFTTPMVGNYGVADAAASRATARARCAHALARRRRVGRVAPEHDLVGLDGIDTRSLVLRCAIPARCEPRPCRTSPRSRRRRPRAVARTAVDGRARRS
jgi:hypothetical protein